MKTAIIISGMPSKEDYFDPNVPAQTNKHWLPWLQRQLILSGILAQTIEMPEPYEPDYKKWCEVFGQFKIDEDTTLVGHSCGGGFLVRWLSENKIKVGKVALVAPWIDPNGKFAPAMFSGMVIDENVAERTAGIIELISLDDDKEELDTLAVLKEKIKGLQVVEFKDRGHFVFSQMKTEEFPELRDMLIK